MSYHFTRVRENSSLDLSSLERSLRGKMLHLRSLGRASKIARWLEREGFKGKRRSARCCPIAEYLNHNSPLPEVRVYIAGPWISVYLKGETEVHIAPLAHMPVYEEGVIYFVRAFDRGTYPELEI